MGKGIYKEKGIWAPQSDAIIFSGKTNCYFRRNIKPKLLMKMVGKRKIYFIPLSLMDDFHRDQQKDNADIPYPQKDEDAALVQDILGDISSGPIEVETGVPSIDIQEARRKEILTRTKYLQQKIVDKKHQLFEQWSERFFGVFIKSFSKFKNSLIELHLNEEQINRLNENLDCAISNLQQSLSDIQNEYLNEEEESQDGK